VSVLSAVCVPGSAQRFKIRLPILRLMRAQFMQHIPGIDAGVVTIVELEQYTVMADGKVIASGVPEDVRRHPAVRTAYLGAETLHT